MKNFIQFTTLIFILFSISLFSQNGNFVIFSGPVQGSYSNPTQISWEETALIQPPAVGTVKNVYVYLAGTKANIDTIFIVGDPSEGSLPPTMWVQHINTYAAFIIDYKGNAGWYKLDVSNFNIKTGGISRIAVQHIIKSGGPYFVIDAAQGSVFTSFLNDVYTPNTKFYNIRGTILSLTGGDYFVGIDIDYDIKTTNGKPPAAPPPALVDITSAAGLTMDNATIVSEMVSVADWNGDGFDDISIKNNFFENNKDGTFKNVNAKMNMPNNGTVWADVNNDGLLDCFATNGWKNDKLYSQQTDGTFLGLNLSILAQDAPTVTPLIFDLDNDGLLDIYLANGRKEENGQEFYYQDKMFRNLGNNQFEDLTSICGIKQGEATPYDCWGASLTDYNNDDKTDVFVSTYRLAPDLLYKNLGEGLMTEVGAQTGARGVATISPDFFGHGMGSDWGDFDNDGDLDLCVGNLGHPDERGLSSNPSLILRNTGTPLFKFEDFTTKSGLKFFEMNAGVVWADLNLDGFLDLIHSQYAYYAKKDGMPKYTRFYLNKGPSSNFQFEDKTWDYGSLIHGAWSPVRLDFDNDGDMDVLVASSNENVKLFENRIPHEGNWLSFRLIGNPNKKVNLDAFGTSITVYAGTQKFYRILPGTVMNARSSQSTNEINFGLGMIDKVDKVEVRYNDGKVITINSIDLNRKYKVSYDGFVQALVISKPALMLPLNNQAIDRIRYTFKWFVSGGVDSYDFELATDIGFKNIVESKNVNTNQILLNLAYKTQYYWRVKANSSVDKTSTNFSDIWTFSTPFSSSVDDFSNTFDMNLQVYPNPVVSNCSLSFDLTQTQNLHISLVNQLGKKIKDISNNNFKSGSNYLAFSLDGLENGIYFIVIENDLFKNCYKISKIN